MKKWLIIYFYLIFSLINLFNSKDIFASTNNFARAMKSTILYKFANSEESISDSICLVEQSYFVEILGDYDKYFKVNYNGIEGFVKKNDVKEITNTPFTPYPYNIKLTLQSDCNLRKTPTTKSQSNNIITTLKSGESDFTFVGRIFADEAIDFGGTTWYLVNYKGEYGYIYNKYIKTITPIYENTEEVTFKETINQTSSFPISKTSTIILIAIMFIPCLTILLILYIPRKTKSAKVTGIKEIYKY